MSYYTEIQYAGKDGYVDITLEYLNRRFLDNKKILELGCGFFKLGRYSHKMLVGVDIDKDLLSYRERLKGMLVFSDVSVQFPFKDEVFDVVFGSHIIEHLLDPLVLVKESFRVLKEGGVLIIITPDWRLRYNAKVKNFYDDYTHKTPFTQKSLGRILYDAGFRNYEVFHTLKTFRGMGRLHKYLAKRGYYRHLDVLAYLSRKGMLHNTDLVGIGYK